jgi:hypothetical protein
MKHSTRMAVAALALVASVSVAAAAGMSKSSTTGSASAISQPADSMSLSPSDKTTAWNDISKIGRKETPPVGFNAVIGAVVPSVLGTEAVPASTADKVPTLRPYHYALLDSNKLLIVNPKDNKIAEVITQ